MRSAELAGGAAPDPDGLEVADVVSRLRRAMRRAARASGRDGTLPGGQSVAQLELLSCLSENPGARPGQLARMLYLAPSSVATLINGLRLAGLVSRTGGRHDRRTASVHLTSGGAAVVAAWQELNERILEAAAATLSPASRESLGAGLAGLHQLTSAVDALADAPRRPEPAPS